MTTATPSGERRSPRPAEHAAAFPATTTNPAADAFRASVLRRIGRLAGQPERLAAVLNGLALDGTLDRVGLPSGLAPMMRLPGPEPERHVRARMADFIQRCVAGGGSCTRDELLGPFSDAEIVRHARAAGRIAGVAAMAV